MNTFPWPGKSLVGEEAASAWMSLVKNYVTVQQQLDLMPVIAAGLNNSEIMKNDDLASFVDRLRIRVGQPQLFGTQLSEQNGFIVLYPLQSDDNVDAFRKEFGMEDDPNRKGTLHGQDPHRRGTGKWRLAEL